MGLLWIRLCSNLCGFEDFTDEGGEAGAPGKTEGPADWGADETWG
jgi:hypothetical protein